MLSTTHRHTACPGMIRSMFFSEDTQLCVVLLINYLLCSGLFFFFRGERWGVRIGGGEALRIIKSYDPNSSWWSHTILLW